MSRSDPRRSIEGSACGTLLAFALLLSVGLIHCAPSSPAGRRSRAAAPRITDIERYCDKLAQLIEGRDEEQYQECMSRQQAAKARVTARTISAELQLQCTRIGRVAGGFDYIGFEACVDNKGAAP